MMLSLVALLVAAGPSRASERDPLATLVPGHPRLLFTNASFAGFVAAAKSDPLRAKLHQHIVAAAERQLHEPMIEYDIVVTRLLGQSRNALAQVTTSAFAYRLTGDKRFLARARDVMLTAAAFPDWNPSHFLDVAEMATALGLGYDWLYEDLAEEDRATIRAALRTKALAYARHAYSRQDVDRESYAFVGNNLHNNWNQVCNGGFLVAALALAAEEPELARAVIAGVRETLPHAMRAYEPDGAYPEGPVYWGYGTRFNVLILAVLESALGDDFGLGQLPGFDRTALFRVQVQSPTGLSFNFADGRAILGADSGLSWLGQRYGHRAAVAHSRQLLTAELERTPNPRDRFLATHAIWFPAEPADEAATGLPLDVQFDGASKVAILRSAWDDPAALWTGLKAGSNRVNHGHLDLGSFMLDADGERWAVDLGPDEYNLPGYWSSATVQSPRWQYFRLNNRSHNTITPGDVLQLPDADAPIVAFGSTPARAFAVADLSSSYPDHGDDFRRGVALLDRARVLVQDEIAGLRAGTPVRWQMLTGAQVGTSGSRALLAQNGRTLRLDVLQPAGVEFRVRPASPPTPVEDQNEGISILAFDLPGAGHRSNLRIAVLLTPVGDRWPTLPVPEVIPLEAWK